MGWGMNRLLAPATYILQKGHIGPLPPCRTKSAPCYGLLWHWVHETSLARCIFCQDLRVHFLDTVKWGQLFGNKVGLTDRLGLTDCVPQMAKLARDGQSLQLGTEICPCLFADVFVLRCSWRFSNKYLVQLHR